MKILHVADTGGVYGKEQVILNLAKNQNELHQVAILSTGKPDFFQITMKIGIESYFATNFSNFESVVDEIRPDIIHAHDYKTGIFSWLAASCPIVRTLHGYTGKGQPWHNRIHIYESVDKLMVRMGFYSKTIGVSPNMIQDFKVDVCIPNSIATFEPLPKSQIREDILDFCSSGYIVGCTARLNREKNLINLIEAGRLLQDESIKIIIFGDGPLTSELNDLVTQYKLNHKILLTGYVAQVNRHLHLIDCYIQPSLTEGTPISVLEAFSARIPTIVTNVGGMRALIQEKACYECGHNPNDIAQKITALKNNKEYQNHLVTTGYSLFERGYSLDKMIKGYEQVYREVTSR